VVGEVGVMCDLHCAGGLICCGGTRRTVSSCEARGFARLEFGGFCGVPHRVAINKSANCGILWNRIGNLRTRLPVVDRFLQSI